jgi:hypothetical protein
VSVIDQPSEPAHSLPEALAEQRRRERAAPSSSVQYIPYEVPVRPAVRARLVLPEDLTEPEAERLCAFIRAVAFDEPDGERA